MRIELSPSPSRFQTTTTARSNSVTQGRTHHDNEGPHATAFCRRDRRCLGDHRHAPRPRRTRGGQAHDRPLGPLGARRQRRQHGKLIEEWAAKEKVEVQIDYITTQGNKLLLTEQAEAQSQDRPRHHDIPLLGPGRSRQAARARRRHHGAADQAERRRQRDGEVSGQARGPLGRGAGDARQQRQGTVLAHRPHEAACRHRRAGHVSGRRLRPRRTPGHSTPSCKAAEACHKAGFPFGIGLGTTTDSVDSAGAIFDAFGAAPGRCQGQHHRQDRRRAPGARLLYPARPLLPGGRAGLGRRLQQQVRWSRARAR